MKRAKPLSTVSKKLTSVPELPYKKGLLNSSPKPKEKRNAKPQNDKIEPMVLRSPPTGESIVRYALPIPSSKTKELISEGEMVKKIAKHLKMVVTALEDTYGTVDEDGERRAKEPREEGLTLSDGDDMNSFLLCCSQFAAQLEEAVKEERNILESLFKWFQQQVNQMEEISKDQSIFEKDLLSDGKSVNLNITQITNLVHKFEELKTRLREQRGSLLLKPMDRDTLSESMKSYEAIEKQIEEFIKSHSEYESQVVSETEPETPYSVTDRMNVMIKIFENQTNMLERALNDQSIIETKYKQMETDFQLLLLEKTLLENEIQKMKSPEKAKPTSKEDRTKKPTKPEKKKDKDSERKLSPAREVELLQIQKEAESLKMEKKALQEQLKWALQEAERNKNQLNYVLHQEMEMYKEDRSKTKMEPVLSTTGEDSKHSPTEEKDTQPGEPTQDYDQINSPSQQTKKKRSSSAVLDPSALEGYYGVSDVSASPPEVSKSFAEVPLIEEHQETSPQPKETEMWSLAEASRQIFSHKEAENFEVSYEIPSEKPTPDDKDLLSDVPALIMKQLAKQGRRKPLFITAKMPEYFTSLSRTHSEIGNSEATKYENTNEYEEQDKKIGKEDSKTDIKLKGQKGSKTGKLYTHKEESDKAVYEESTKAKVSAKKYDAAKGKGLAHIDGTLSPDSQSSLSRADIHTKKQKIHKRERSTVSHETPDKSFEHQDLALNFEIQAKKLKIFRLENVHSEVLDKSIRLEDQNVQSSSQIQLKKQQSLGGEIFTIHFAVPDESYARLHQESSSEAQALLERTATSEDARLTVPLEYQKKDASVDNLFLEKKLIITRSQSQNKKYVPPRDDNGEKNELENLKETFERHLLRGEFKALSKGGLEIEAVIKKMTTRSKAKDPMKMESKSMKSDEIKIVQGLKLLGTLKDEHEHESNVCNIYDAMVSMGDFLTFVLNMSLSPKKDISPHKFLIKIPHEQSNSLKTKPQENINAKFHPPTAFPTKVINLSPFTRDMESSTTPKPFYRTSRGSLGIPPSFQHLLNRRTSGDLNPKTENKKTAELENQLNISITSSKKYKKKLLKEGASGRARGKEHWKAQKVEPTNNLKMAASAPNIKVIKELSKTSSLDDEDANLSNNLTLSTSATKKPKSKGKRDAHFLNSSKTSNLENKVVKGSNILHKSTLSLKECVHKGNGHAHMQIIPPTHMLKEKKEKKIISIIENLETNNLENKVVKGSNILHKSTSSLKECVHKGNGSISDSTENDLQILHKILGISQIFKLQKILEDNITETYSVTDLVMYFICQLSSDLHRNGIQIVNALCAHSQCTRTHALTHRESVCQINKIIRSGKHVNLSANLSQPRLLLLLSSVPEILSSIS
ncbi:Ccdc7a [Phodopus roborovskii]|uniref:Ccdc7a protein n=1 Tax=Phodopus roborovskii TaxID=109678 RepID=A0AAV0A0W2_PHORO|nr:Ccdc7a [Phodopus roborovskii]